MGEVGTVGRQAILASVSRAANESGPPKMWQSTKFTFPSTASFLRISHNIRNSKHAIPSPENAVRKPVRPRPVDPVLIRARRRLARRIHLGVDRIVPASDLTGFEERQEQRADFVRRKEMSPRRAIDQMSLLTRNWRSARLRTRSQT